MPDKPDLSNLMSFVLYVEQTVFLEWNTYTD